jgi:hypothetical protein
VEFVAIQHHAVSRLGYDEADAVTVRLHDCQRAVDVADNDLFVCVHRSSLGSAIAGNFFPGRWCVTYIAYASTGTRWPDSHCGYPRVWAVMQSGHSGSATSIRSNSRLGEYSPSATYCSNDTRIWSSVALASTMALTAMLVRWSRSEGEAAWTRESTS